jgi:hypothetical protein
MPNGKLGVPLGQLVELEGTRADGFKFGSGTMVVAKIDGRPPSHPMSVWIEGVDLPKHVRLIVRGYETIDTAGNAPAYEQFAKLKNQPPPNEPQAGWKIYLKFVALEVIDE